VASLDAACWTKRQIGDDWQTDKSIPLGFIAQIDLSAIPRIDDSLPASGWLYFFYDRCCEPWGYDPADRGSCRVIYADIERDALRRTEPPIDFDSEYSTHPCTLETEAELTLPDDMPEIIYETPAYDLYWKLYEELMGKSGAIHHQLLGHPQRVQNPMEMECQLASNGVYCGNTAGYQSDRAKTLECGAKDWRLLLQIDTDEDGPGWMWGDVGRTYFWIKKQDLAQLRFDDVWLVFQCS
jgi:uncharacterized protein YwqG